MTQIKKKILPITDQYHLRSTPSSLVPRSVAFLAFGISFLLPNLVFSGAFFFNTLHLMKWVTALSPLALLGAAAGYKTLRRGARESGFRIDAFALLWLLLLLYITLQPLWTPLRSPETFYREWFFFASLWLAYVLCTLLADRTIVHALLWGALAGAALSVLFAELQVRGLSAPYPFILPTPGHYIANTGQQNMFATWMAISGLGGALLFFSSGGVRNKSLFTSILAVVLLIVVFHGLVASTSRSGILSLAAGFTVLSLFFLRNEGRKSLPRILLIILLFALVMSVNVSLNKATGEALSSKLEDVVQQPLSFAKRDSIWATSWTMFANDPWRGVGLGQYKWHYMEAQKDMILRWPHFRWMYTQWAHNEFLQWMAEAGVVGAALMFLLWIWWGYSLLYALSHKVRLSYEAMWGSALVSLFFVNALWTRPFHRVENVLWLALAFAATNREVLRPSALAPFSERFEKALRALGGVICATSLLGLVFLGNGVYGDRLLRLAEDGVSKGGNMTAVKELYSRAYASPMVRDDAEKQIGYFSVRLGEIVKNPELIAEGLNILIGYFEKMPHVEELNFLTEWAFKINKEDLKQFLDSFVRHPQSPHPFLNEASTEPENGSHDIN